MFAHMFKYAWYFYFVGVNPSGVMSPISIARALVYLSTRLCDITAKSTEETSCASTWLGNLELILLSSQPLFYL